MSKKIISIGLALGAVLMINGCGGSDSDVIALPSTGNTDDPVVTVAEAPTTGVAYYIDSAVAGINYTCGAESGITDADGAFTFEVGSSCTFYLGDVELRSVDAGVLEDGKNVYETDVNIARILMSLDTDGNPDNGITLSAEIIEAIVEAGIEELPDTEEEMEALMAVVEENEGTVVTEDDAQAHLDDVEEQAVAEGLIPAPTPTPEPTVTPEPTATPTPTVTPTATPTPTPTPVEPVIFSTDYLSGKTLYYVQYDDFGHDEQMGFNAAEMTFSSDGTMTWNEIETLDSGVFNTTYSVDENGHLFLFDDQDEGSGEYSYTSQTSDYLKVCEINDNDCNTYFFFDRQKALDFRDTLNGKFTQTFISANPWYRVEVEDNVLTGAEIAYCNGVFDYDGINTLTVSGQDDGVPFGGSALYEIVDGKVVVSHDGKTETETLLTFENSVITTGSVTVEGTETYSGNVKWFINQADAEAFLLTYSNSEASNCF